MDFKQQKEELVKLIPDTEDAVLIHRLKEFIQDYKDDFWHRLPEHAKRSAERSRQQAERGEVVLFDQFKENIRQFTKELRKKS